MAFPLTELVAPVHTARWVGNPVSLIPWISSVSRVGRGWAPEGDQNGKSIQKPTPPYACVQQVDTWTVVLGTLS